MSPSRRCPLTALLVTFGLASGLAALEPRVRASVDAERGHWVGQPATLSLLVEVDTWFTGGVQVPGFEVPGALVRRAPGRAVSSTTREGETTWAGLTQRFLIYPLRQGQVEIPPIPVGVRYSVDGKSLGPIELMTEATSFRATVPEEAKGLGYFIVASSFELEEEIEGLSSELRQGDALTRKVTQRARDTLAMLLPSLEIEAVQGLRLYPAEPRIEDVGGERGEERQALRVDSATYVLEEVGSFVLPAMNVSWWDLGERRLRITELAAVEIEVAENPDLAEHLGGMEDGAELVEEEVGSTGNGMKALASLAVIGLMVWIGLPWLGRAWRVVEAHRVREPTPGEHELEAFRKAAKEGDAEATYRYLIAWLDRIESALTLSELVAGQKDPVLQTEVSRLSEHLFGARTGTPWKPGELVAAVGRIEHRRAAGSRAGRPLAGLPSLNPH